MDKPVILISAICGDIGYSAVRSVRESVSKIIGCDIRSYSPVTHLVDKFYEVPPASDTESYIDFLKGIIRKESIQFFLPVSEPEIEVINLMREEFEKRGVKLLLNSKSILDNFLDKLKTAQYLESIGIKAPRTVLLKVYDGSFGFPLIVKERKGYGSKRLWKVDNLIDLDYIRTKDDGCLIVQEYIGTAEEEYTTGVFSDGKNISSISFKRKLGPDGTTLEALLVNEFFLNRLSMQIAINTSLVGYINIQSRRVMDIFVPFEINPRISGTVLFRKAFGFDDIIWWINVLLGKRYCYKPLYKSGRGIRYYSESYFDMEKVI